MVASTSLLRLLQLTDSGFPTGAFAFSHGLEGLMAAGQVTAEPDISGVIAAHLREGFAGIECPAMAHAWRAAHRGDIDELVELDHLVNALKPIPVYCNGSARTGRRLLESAAGILASPAIEGMRERVRSRTAFGHHAVAFGVVMEGAGIDEETASLALGSGFVNSLAAAAVRLGIVGAGAAQRMTADVHGEIAAAAVRGRQMPREEMGAYLPMIDIAGLRHATLRSRVFAS